MIRALGLFVLLASVSLACAWAANQPGHLRLDWFGWTIDARPIAALGAAVLLVAVSLLIARLWTGLRWRSGLFGPGRVLHRQRSARPYSAGALAAWISGQPRYAGDLAARALRLDPDDWTATTVAALAGDAGQDARLRADPTTTLLAALAAYVRSPSRASAELAASLAPASPFAWEAALDQRARDDNFPLARAALSNWQALDPDLGATATWIGASLDHEAAKLALAQGDRNHARHLYESALKACPGFAPAAIGLAELLADDDRPLDAARVLETAWQAAPAPSLLAAYTAFAPTETQAERYKRVQRLANLAPAHPESRLALASHALAAGDSAQALEALAPLLAEERPRVRAAQLAAQAHRRLGFDPPPGTAWLSALDDGAPDPDWRCTRCRAHARAWHPICPACGGAGRLAWDQLS